MGQGEPPPDGQWLGCKALDGMRTTTGPERGHNRREGAKERNYDLDDKTHRDRERRAP